MKKSRILLIVGLMLALCLASIAGTVAWLTDKTEPVVNTFSPSNIDVSLKESTGNTYQLVPGKDIIKDPKVSASSNVPYYVFVKVVETNWDVPGVSYEIAEGWDALTGVTLGDGVKVYYKALNDNAALNDVSVLKNNKVLVANTLTQADMPAANDLPTLSFTAYAIQQEGFANAALAWAEVSK